jgi:hypothetical protein
VGFVVDKVTLGQFFRRVLRFSRVNFIPLVLHYKGKRKKIIIFITGLHNKPQGCGASVAFAAGPFKTKQKKDCVGGGSALAKPQPTQGSEKECGIHTDLGFYFERNFGSRFHFIGCSSTLSHAHVHIKLFACIYYVAGEIHLRNSCQ